MYMQYIPSPKLSNLQLELLKIYSFTSNEEDLKAIKKMLATYFANKLTTLVNKAVEKQGITEDDLDNWLNSEEQ